MRSASSVCVYYFQIWTILLHPTEKTNVHTTQIERQQMMCLHISDGGGSDSGGGILLMLPNDDRVAWHTTKKVRRRFDLPETEIEPN